MYLDEYWKKFEPVSTEWHIALAVVSSIVSIFAFVVNVMVLYYLIRYLSQEYLIIF